MTYHINTDDFTAPNEIEAGGDAWDAGSGEVNRGADWDFIRGSDNTNDGTYGNGTNNVRKKDDTWFSNQGLAADVAAVTANTLVLCVRDDSDITFRESITWSTGSPSEITSGALSLGQTAAHEFGHSLGLDHENDLIAVMNTTYPFGGDLGDTHFRLNEDDYVGLTNQKSDSSTGKDLTLSVFVYDGGGNAHEGWNFNHTFDLSLNDWIDGAPHDIWAVINGTSSQSPVIQWRVSTNTCFDGVGTEYNVGSLTPNIGSNTPYAVAPGAWAFSGVPPGTYRLCAMIDSTTAITESDENDNVIESDADIIVQN
jgi:hypothetical protein